MAESKESFTRAESVAKWEGAAAYEAEREAVIFVFYFSPVQGVPIDRNLFLRGTGICIISIFFGFIFIVFCGAALPGCAFSLRVKEEKAVCRTAVLTASMSKEENDYPTSGMSVRTACERA